MTIDINYIINVNKIVNVILPSKSSGILRNSRMFDESKYVGVKK